MRSARPSRCLAWLPLAAAGVVAGCGAKSNSTTSALTADADFSACAPAPQAVRYAPGISVVSTSGAYRATITSASTMPQTGGPAVPTTAPGYATFMMTVTTVTDGGTGSDAGAPPPDGLTMMPPPTSPTYPADPYMPLHGHGASTVPAVTAQGGGVFSVAEVDFFMAGYWQLYLELVPPGAAADPLTFELCIPSD